MANDNSRFLINLSFLHEFPYEKIDSFKDPPLSQYLQTHKKALLTLHSESSARFLIPTNGTPNSLDVCICSTPLPPTTFSLPEIARAAQLEYLSIAQSLLLQPSINWFDHSTKITQIGYLEGLFNISNFYGDHKYFCEQLKKSKVIIYLHENFNFVNFQQTRDNYNAFGEPASTYQISRTGENLVILLTVEILDHWIIKPVGGGMVMLDSSMLSLELTELINVLDNRKGCFGENWELITLYAFQKSIDDVSALDMFEGEMMW
ncbi:hypothetical protein HK098_001474, partial [Nowakowskiella sp. JEL0407]